MKSSRFTSASICALLFSLLLQTATCRSADAGQALSVKPAAMDLKSAILYAVEHAPALDSARKTRDIRELEYRNAVSKLLPSVDFKTVDGLQNNIPVSDNSLALLAANPSRPWYSSINLGVSETLYDNGKTLIGISVARLNRELADVSFQKARDSLALSVANEFYKYSLDLALFRVQKQQLRILQRQFDEVSTQFKEGLKTRIDYLRFKTEVQRSEISLNSAQSNIQLEAAQIRGLLGMTPADAETSKVTGFQEVPVDTNVAFRELFPGEPIPLQKIYDYRIAKLQKDINASNVDLAKREYWPQISLTTGAIYSNLDYLNAPTPFEANNQLTWNALVTLQYNLWDWGILKRNVEIAQMNWDVQSDQLESSLLDIRTQVDQLATNMDLLSRNYRLTDELLKLENESYQRVQTQYHEGKVTYLDLITSLGNLLSAQVQYNTIYFGSLQNLAKYRYYKGTLYENLVAK